MKWRWANVGLPLLSKELAEMAQRRRTYVARVAFAVLMFSTSVLAFLPTYDAFRGAPWRFFGCGAKLLDLLYAVEWGGLVLLVPAIVSGALTAEKERNTLQLLFLTRLGPWTILIEKLLSRLVPVATFLLVSLPLVFVAYLWGGLTQTDLELAIMELAVVAFQLASIALFCSAFCATSAGAFILSYVMTALVFLLPFLAVLGILVSNWCSEKLGAGQTTWFLALNAPENHAVVGGLITATLGMDLDWVFGRGFLPSGTRPFHTAPQAFVIMALIGLLFLLLARGEVVRRAVPQPKHRIRRLFAWLDRVFTGLNDEYAHGILIATSESSLPGSSPILWREERRGNLGRVNDLVRVLILLESPFLVVSVTSAVLFRDDNFNALGTIGLCFWPIALAIVIVRAAGLIGAEKARQTLDVLLTTPLSLSELMGAKLRGLRRVMAIVAVPIIFQTLLIAVLRLALGRPLNATDDRQSIASGGEALVYIFATGLNIVILFGLAAQLAFLLGLCAKTQGRAATAALGIFAVWSFLPVITRSWIDGSWAWNALYLSPIADILVNEFPLLGEQWVNWHGRPPGGLPMMPDWHFYPILQSALYVAVVACLAAINRRLAAHALLRPMRGQTPPHPLSGVPQLAE